MYSNYTLESSGSWIKICLEFAAEVVDGIQKPHSVPQWSTYFKIDMTIWKTIGTTLVEEVNIFDQEAEEWYHDLRKEQNYSQTGAD